MRGAHDVAGSALLILGILLMLTGGFVGLAIGGLACGVGCAFVRTGHT
jgi:hypothetical protein